MYKKINQERKQTDILEKSLDSEDLNQNYSLEKSIVHVEDFTMAYTDKPVIWDIDLDIPSPTMSRAVLVPSSRERIWSE